MRQDESRWEKIVVLWEFFAHQSQVLAKLVFVGDHPDSGPLRDPLIRANLVELVRRYGKVKPANVEFFGLTLSPCT